METVHIEHIENYLDGAIDRNELTRRCPGRSTAELEADIRWVRDLRLAVEAEGVHRLAGEAVRHTGEDAGKGGKLKMLSPRTWLQMSLAAVLLLLVGAFFWLRPDRYERMYEQFLFEDPGLPLKMGDQEEYTLYDAMTYYSEGNFTESARRLASLAAESEGEMNDTVWYYIGASELYRGRAHLSDEWLTPVAATESSVYADRADWLLVLSAVRQKDEAALKARLGGILADEGHDYYSSAQELQNRLK